MNMNLTNEALDKALTALKTYDTGSDRARLMPIDDAVGASSRDAALREKLEQQFISLLKEPLASEAKEYLCRKLSLIGAAASVPVLAGFLEDSRISEAARQALEVMPGPEATRALSEALRKHGSLHPAGLINALGMRKAVSAVPLLIDRLEDPNPQIIAAAAAALGNMGTPKAARALEAFLPKAAESLRPRIAEACLMCADRCRETGQPRWARALYQVLSHPPIPAHIQKAAQRNLQRLA